MTWLVSSMAACSTPQEIVPEAISLTARESCRVAASEARVLLLMVHQARFFASVATPLLTT